MESVVLVSFCLCAGLELLSWLVTKRAVAALSAAQKAQLVDANVSASTLWYAVALLSCGAFLAVVVIQRHIPRIVAFGVFGLFLATSIAAYVATQRTYRRAGMPTSFLRAFSVRAALRLAAAAVLLGAGVLYFQGGVAT